MKELHASSVCGLKERPHSAIVLPLTSPLKYFIIYGKLFLIIINSFYCLEYCNS
jgi:hypothetical protein